MAEIWTRTFYKPMKKIIKTIADQAWPACTQITALILVIVGLSVYGSGGVQVGPLGADPAEIHLPRIAGVVIILFGLVLVFSNLVIPLIENRTRIAGIIRRLVQLKRRLKWSTKRQHLTLADRIAAAEKKD